MELLIERDIFLEALQLVVSISPKASSEPIINNVLLETRLIDGEDYLQVKATNYDKSFLGNFKIKIIESGQLCMNTSRLFNLVREFREQEIKIHSTPQNWVFLICGNSKVKLPCVDSGLFPIIEFKELSNQITIPGDALKTAIDRTFFTIGENESRKNLMGLNLFIEDGAKIRWISADGFRISRFFTELENETTVEGNIIIPKNSLSDIKRILTLNKESVTISFNENEFQIQSQLIKFKTRLIEADYPNLDTLVNNVGNITLSIAKEEFINAIKIIATLTEGEPHSFVKIVLQEGRLLINSQKLDFGEGNDEIYCDYSGEEVTIGLNTRFLLEAMMAFDSAPDDHVFINLSKSVLPFSVFCEAWENFKTVLMPVKIEW